MSARNVIICHTGLDPGSRMMAPLSFSHSEDTPEESGDPSPKGSGRWGETGEVRGKMGN